mgnify:CR=1 FL=1
MIKQMAWNTFKKTGSIDSYLELVELENVEKDILKTERLDGNKTNQIKENLK